MRILLAASLAITLSACATAPKSRWESNELAVPGYGEHVYMVCKCDGIERQPTPSEADSFRDGERVDLYCEGKVRDCRRGELQTPGSRRSTGPNNPNTLD